MKAITFQDKQSLRYEDIPDPTILQDGDAIVRVHIAGVCGSDLHVYHGRETGIDCGTAMGHEFVGEIVETGGAVQGFRKGDIVISPFTTNCGICYFCTIGLTCRCVHNQFYGWREKGEGLHGGQAEYVRVPMADTTLMLLPEGVSQKAGLMLGDNFSTGYYCAEQADIQANGTYAILGCGSVGLMAILAVRMLAAEHIYAIDAIPERLQKAKSFGAIPINFKTQNPVEIIMDATKDIGVDAVLEVVGSSEASSMAMRLVRPGGIISTVGVHTTPFAFSPADAYDKNLIFKIGRCPARHYMTKLTDKLTTFDTKISSVITHEFDLAEGVEAYRIFDKKEDGCIKSVLRS